MVQVVTFHQTPYEVVETSMVLKIFILGLRSGVPLPNHAQPCPIKLSVKQMALFLGHAHAVELLYMPW